MGKVVEFLPEEHPTRANFNKKFREITNQLTPEGVGAISATQTIKKNPFPFVDDIVSLDSSGYFWKNALGEVHLIIGYFGHSSEAVFPNAWSIIGMLPEGFRPPGTMYWTCSNADDVLSTLYINGTGAVGFRPNAENQRYGGGVNITFLAEL